MNYSKIEVIGIDHGWSMMKTVSQVFITGAREIRTEPAVFDDVLVLDGKENLMSMRYLLIGTLSDHHMRFFQRKQWIIMKN